MAVVGRMALTAWLACLVTVLFSWTALAASGVEEVAQPSQQGLSENREQEAGQGEALSEAEAKASIPGQWTGDTMNDRYRLENGKYLEKSWLFHSGRWYYLDEYGYPASEWRKVRGKWYYFDPDTGRMAVGWLYDSEEDQWFYLDQDGARHRGWLQAGEDWYWFDSKGVMYDDGWRMVDGHKYYFNEDGLLASGQYIGTAYYGTDGRRDTAHDIVITGDRKPEEEEKEAITRALGKVPRQWMERFLEDGWELMYYTDRKYFEAPGTEEGIYYVYHKTDIHYKKLKFTDPDSLTRAFGEYVAHETGNDEEENEFLADLYRLLEQTSSAARLPSYFDHDSQAWFGVLFENYCDPEIRGEMKAIDPQLCQFMDETLGVDYSVLRPSVWEATAEQGEDGFTSITEPGPAFDPELNQKKSSQ